METPYNQFKELRTCKKIAADLLEGKKFETVLEIGSQWGENLMAIKDKFPDVQLAGIDIDEETTKNAKQITGLDLRIGNAFDLKGFKEGEFDVVVAVALFCMLQPLEIEIVLKEILRIAKKFVILVELKTSEKTGFVRGGRTGANWNALLKKYKIVEKKITAEEWDANPWIDHGYSYLIKK